VGKEGKKKPDEYAPDFDFRIFGRAGSVGEETGAGAAEGRVVIPSLPFRLNEALADLLEIVRRPDLICGARLDPLDLFQR
jgi:hypothetical protein